MSLVPSAVVTVARPHVYLIPNFLSWALRPILSLSPAPRGIWQILFWISPVVEIGPVTASLSKNLSSGVLSRLLNLP